MNKHFAKYIWLLFSCTLLISTQALAKEIPTNQDAFTEYAAEKIRLELVETPVSVKAPLTLSVGELQANLHRIFSFCNDNKPSCSDELDRFVKGLAQAYKDSNTPPDKNAIRLIIRTTEYLENSLKQIKGSGSPPISEPFITGFVMMPVLDTPRAIRSLGEKDLKTLNLTQKELFDLGKSNLKSNLKPLTEIAKPVKSGEIGTIFGSIYDVSRVSIQSEWLELANNQNGALLISMPTTDKIIYVSESTPSAIDALRTISKDIMSKSSNPLSNRILKWTPSKWELAD
jgi:uncharacterized protein YtpQ (UPF0354 family)